MSQTTKLLQDIRKIGHKLGESNVSARDVKEAYDAANKSGGPLALRALKEGFREGIKDRNADNRSYLDKGGREMNEVIKALNKIGKSIKQITDGMPGSDYLDDIFSTDDKPKIEIDP